MTQKELDEILKKHKMWLNDENSGERANLRNADLRNADLGNANLWNADLGNANLRNADLRNANLRNADLRNANLRYADLGNANLRYANLWNADLGNANLWNADLRNANLRYADLGNANLRYANLWNADLGNANLRYANLWNADLGNAKNIPYVPMVCPEQGAFYGYKKVSGYIIKLFIPADAKRSSSTSRKCRCSYAKVISITNLDESKTDSKEIINTTYIPNVIYKVGEYVYPDSFDENRWNECSHGIHFFINRQEAVNY